MVDRIPRCPVCTGIVKPDIVFFGEPLPQRFLLHVIDFPMADLLLILGTSLEVCQKAQWGSEYAGRRLEGLGRGGGGWWGWLQVLWEHSGSLPLGDEWIQLMRKHKCSRPREQQLGRRTGRREDVQLWRCCKCGWGTVCEGKGEQKGCGRGEVGAGLPGHITETDFVGEAVISLKRLNQGRSWSSSG